MQRVTTLPAVLIVGTGDEAESIAAELQMPGRTARNVIGFFATSENSVEKKNGIPVFLQQVFSH